MDTMSRNTRCDFGARLLSQVPAIRAVGLRMLWRREDLDDFIQEVLCRAYGRQAALRDDRKLDRWVAAIAGNLARNWNRRKRPEPVVDVPDTPDPSPDPLESAHSADRWREVVRALAAMPPGDRELLVRYHIDGDSYGELQHDYGVSYKTISFRLSRARGWLRARLSAIGAALAALLSTRPERTFGGLPVRSRGIACITFGALTLTSLVGIGSGIGALRASDGLNGVDTPRTVRVANVGRVAPEGAGAWTALRIGIPDGDVPAVAFSPDGAAMFVGTDAHGAYRSEDDGATWTRMTPEWFPRVWCIAVSPAASETIYASGYGGVIGSDDDGTTWTRTDLDVGIVFVLGVDPEDARTAYATAVGRGVYRTRDGGDSWTPINEGYAHATTALPITPHPADRSVLYSGSVSGGVWRSDDGGDSWHAKGLADRGILPIVVHPLRREMVFVGTGEGGLFRSSDRGERWSAIFEEKDGYHTVGLAVHPTDPDIIYVGTEGGGIYRTLTGGAAWEPISTGLTDSKIRTLRFHPSDPTRLYAVTFADVDRGGGLFVLRTDRL